MKSILKIPLWLVFIFFLSSLFYTMLPMNYRLSKISNNQKAIVCLDTMKIKAGIKDDIETRIVWSIFIVPPNASIETTCHYDETGLLHILKLRLFIDERLINSKYLPTVIGHELGHIVLLKQCKTREQYNLLSESQADTVAVRLAGMEAFKIFINDLWPWSFFIDNYFTRISDCEELLQKRK